MSRAKIHRSGLTRDEQVRLFAHVEPLLRTLALYTLARRFRLGAEGLSDLDLGEVTPNGRTVRKILRLGPEPLLERPLDPTIADVLKRFLVSRCSCAHWHLALKTYRDVRGANRCLVCHEDICPWGNPLFISKKRRRLSPTQMRHEFRQHRKALGLHPRLTFESLLMPTESAIT